VKRENFKGLLS